MLSVSRRGFLCKPPSASRWFTSLALFLSNTTTNNNNTPAESNTTDDIDHKYSRTVLLPSTSFPNRSNKKLINTQLLPTVTDRLYNWQYTTRSNNHLFILHDGPPYANGDLHLGHSVNKILKDIINRYNVLIGKKVYYRPGWDCHGLPIELMALDKISKKLKKKKLDTKSFTPVKIREIAEKHALQQIENQRAQFKSFAIMGDFDNPYLTLSSEFQLNQLKIFYKMFQKNLIKRKKKPVYWGCETNTALAEGELEYNENHKSTATYLLFPLIHFNDDFKSFLQNNKINFNNENLSCLIWTSTPWTIASNKAICINQKLNYSLIHSPEHGYLVVAEDLASKISSLTSSESSIITSFPGSLLLNNKYKNPLITDDSINSFPIIHGDHVTNTAGTGLVHTAPGHGNDDYFACLNNGITDILSPVDGSGRYTNELPNGFEVLIGHKVLGEGTLEMLRLLHSQKMIYHSQDLIHSYPYDWRSKKPIVIRSTPQWFADLSNIRETATESLSDVNFVPQRGLNRLTSFIKNRNEWCISRQRSWGVPIPCFYHKQTGQFLMNQDTITHLIQLLLNGTSLNSWFQEEEDISYWLPNSYKSEAHNYTKGKDTMDVWFDSGSSWTLIELYLNSQNLLNSRKYLADVYLEGSDQHRGWFQSSLLTKVAAGSLLPENNLDMSFDKQAPYKTIITHGFTLDEKGQKMSKSIGNTILPDEIILGKKGLKPLGIDGLRLWVAQSDFTHDISIGLTIMKHVTENLIKIRFTFKFLLGNLNDFSYEKDAIEYENLNLIDKYCLSKIYNLYQNAHSEYSVYNYKKLIQLINNNINITLSSLYFDVCKDRLYVDGIDSLSRRSAQTVLFHVLMIYLKILSPILPLMTQEATDNIPIEMAKIFKTDGFFSAYQIQIEDYFNEKFINGKIESFIDDYVSKLKDQLLLMLEQGRILKTIKNSLESQVQLVIKSGSEMVYWNLLEKEMGEKGLSDLLLVSNVRFVEEIPETIDSNLLYDYRQTFEIGGDKFLARVLPSEDFKCPRCWKYTAKKEKTLCSRCDELID
ncbi:isoleucine--tRNA ligase ISM1 [Ascoidea rubescens DSM 1968]|uniref:isoleucine--tRNA ligase n=1 Tax=Ascoidea rubescens DSM 1968 TaxID=1344418 RepID=A0A1D2VQP7_9ASCO|nr:isoleucyl-tRNA synthetase [Ascoidea rubescens DSM 1968]ODV63887.1 isoleucyl-tRNA synthetase [Ascoidea rubescens DSM 1968]